MTQRKYSAVRDSVKLHLTIYDAILCRGALAGGTLTFRASTRLDYERKQLLVAETHLAERDGREDINTYDFNAMLDGG